VRDNLQFEVRAATTVVVTSAIVVGRCGRRWWPVPMGKGEGRERREVIKLR